MIVTTIDGEMENTPCNPCQLELFEITQYQRSSETLVIRQAAKVNRVKIKMTSYAVGETKKVFIGECQQRGLAEAEVIRQNIKVYHTLLKKFPQLVGKEYKEINAFIMNLPE